MKSVSEKLAVNNDLWASEWNLKEQPFQIRLGDLSLSIKRQTHEWLLNYHWQKLGNEGAFDCYFADDDNQTGTKTSRLAVNSESRVISLQAKLADRPVVVRPHSPLTIPAHHKITLYVSTPLWLGISLADIQIELPLQQLSDTWMGSLTGNGSLCYGSLTHARLDKSLLAKLPFRALTPISMNNQSNENFTLERLSIPAPYLSLYEGQGQLTTEPLSFVMDAKNHQGSVVIDPPGEGKWVSAAREIANRGILSNTWENLFA